jgi:hypothetical protein
MIVGDQHKSGQTHQYTNHMLFIDNFTIKKNTDKYERYSDQDIADQ